MKCSFFVVLRLLVASLALFNSSPAKAAVLPDGFVEQSVGLGWTSVVGVQEAKPSAGLPQRLFVWEAYGKVWLVENGVKRTTPVVDIAAEVGNFISLLGFALDPDFNNNGFIYLFYTVDRAVLLGGGSTGPTIGRLTRYTCPAGGNRRTADPASRLVLIGQTKSTGIPVVERSHGMGALVFSNDGTLLVSTGDSAGGSETVADVGGSPNAVQAVADGILPASQNVGAWRAQSLDCMSGKILRIDPATGNGVASNPYFQTATPASARSRVWALGLRNPFRFCQYSSAFISPTEGRPGTYIIGDAGWNSEDSVFVCHLPGQNFGWPAFEGFSATPGYSAVTPPAFVNLANRVQPMAAWSVTSAKARIGTDIYTLGSVGSQVAGASFGGKASIGGIVVPNSDAWPLPWRGNYLHLDWGASGQAGWVRMFENLGVTAFADGKQRITQVQQFGYEWKGISHMAAGRDSLYYVEWPDTVRRILPDTATSVGLVQERYANNTFSGTAVASVVQAVDFGSGLPTGQSSSRWTGFLVPPTTESYTFFANANDRLKVWLNDTLVINVGSLNDGVDDYWLAPSASIALYAGVRYRLKVEHANDGGNGVAVLFWETPTRPLTAIDGTFFKYENDVVSPTVALTAPASTPANTAFQVVVEPSEPWVQIPSTGSIQVEGGAAGGFEPNGAGAYTLQVTPTQGASVVTVQFVAGAFTDAAGNQSLASSVTTTVVGTIAAPTGVLRNDLVAASTPGPFGVEVLWSRSLTDLTASDAIVTNGTATRLLDLNGGYYLLSIQPTAAGAVTVRFPAAVAQGLDGMPNEATPTFTTNYMPPAANATGLLTTFFDDSDFFSLVNVRNSTVGTNVDYRWGTGGLPALGSFSFLQSDRFSLRASGSVTAPVAGDYTFVMDHDDAARLYIDDVLVYNGWLKTGIHWEQQSVPVAFAAGQKKSIRLEYKEVEGNAEVFLYWKSATQPLQLVPMSALKPESLIPNSGAPTLTLTGPTSTVIPSFDVVSGVSASFNVKITPSEPVTGLAESDFSFVGCLPLSPGNSLSQVAGDGSYTLSVKATSTRPTVTILAGSVVDASGNVNAASTAFSLTIPTLISLQSLGFVGDELKVRWTVFPTFWANPTASQFQVSNGTAVSIVNGPAQPNGTEFILTVKAAAPGVVTVSLPANTVLDANGVGNSSSNVISAIYTPTVRSNGVTTAYFNNASLSGNSVLNTIAPNVNFDWGGGAPGAGIAVDQYSARFTGCIIPPTTGTYTIYVRADDGARLWINNVLKFDHFNGDNGEWSASFAATAGMPVAVKIEYREGWGGSSISASWSATGLAKQIIPASRWLVNETGLVLPIEVSVAEDMAAIVSQVPASYQLALESIPSIGASLHVTTDLTALSWECLESSLIYLQPEQSLDLISWEPLDAAAAAVSPANAAAYRRVSLPLPANVTGNCYFRLRVVR